MNDLNVAIVFECADKDLAEQFGADLARRKYKVTFTNELSFPQEETAIPFLWDLSSKYDLVFILISDNSDYLHSIYNKLKSQQLFSESENLSFSHHEINEFKNFKNLYPVFFIS